MVANGVIDHEANRFAIELLMPRDWVLRDMAALGPIDAIDDRRIVELAKRYGVSTQMMTLRIAELARERGN